MFHGALTGGVDGVQADSPGSDEKSNPLQLAVSHVVLENNVVWEVHIADWLQRSGALAADWDATVPAVSLDSHGLGHGAFVVLHPVQNIHLPLVSLEEEKKTGQIQQHFYEY